jgi:nicotinamide phosphoribosyltransferase
MQNIILDTDSYKASHYLQYPPKTKFISSYIEARGGAYKNVLFFGLQMALATWLSKPVLKENIDEAEWFFKQHGLVFNRDGWNKLIQKHHGYLPLRIQALAEGSIVPVSTPLVQVTNTDPEFYWLTSYIETALLRAVWYPTTVATRSAVIRKIIQYWMYKTSDDPEPLLPFKLHDFGARGVSSYESAKIGGCAHLINFKSSDNIPGIIAAKKFYRMNMAGFSIPAAEHSTITSWGRYNEEDAYKNMLDQFAKPGSAVAIVVDSYDIYRAVREIFGTHLKERIQNCHGTIVLRPDSGDATRVPVEIIEMLGEKFGFETNGKGFRVLPSCVRVIQGDGINERSIEAILTNLANVGYSADNISFGMGGELLQTVNRDTMKFAMKASAVKFDGDWIGFSKDPIADAGKRSKKGRLAVVRRDGEIKTVNESDLKDRELQFLRDVYIDGIYSCSQTFSEIRALAASQSI